MADETPQALNENEVMRLLDERIGNALTESGYELHGWSQMQGPDEDTKLLHVFEWGVTAKPIEGKSSSYMGVLALVDTVVQDFAATYGLDIVQYSATPTGDDQAAFQRESVRKLLDRGEDPTEYLRLMGRFDVPKDDGVRFVVRLREAATPGKSRIRVIRSWDQESVVRQRYEALREMDSPWHATSSDASPTRSPRPLNSKPSLSRC